MNIKSSRETFLEDLETTMNLMAGINEEGRVKITIPAVGMGLWRKDPRRYYLYLRNGRKILRT